MNTNMEAMKVDFAFNSSKDDSDSDASSEDSSAHMELERMFTLPKMNTLFDKNESTHAKKARNEKERLPTRRPDPNVYNRNALLARENRRKKKAHLETLEKALHECNRVNTALLNALKRERKLTRRLEREKMYYKNIVSNRTEIVNLVSVLNGHLRHANSTSPQRICNLSRTSPAQDSLYSYSGSSNYEPEYPAFSYDYSENEMEHPSLEEAWNELLHDKNFGLHTDNENKEDHAKELNIEKDISNNISKEHSYVTSNSEEQVIKDVTGVCLHIAGGKVSLEFCPTCHFSANQFPPMQLLQEDAVA